MRREASKVLTYGLEGITTLAAAGFSITGIAREIGVSRTTLRDSCHRHWSVALVEKYELVPVNAGARVASLDKIAGEYPIGAARVVLDEQGPAGLWRYMGTNAQTGERWLTKAGVKTKKVIRVLAADPKHDPDQRIARCRNAKKEAVSGVK